MLFDWVASSTPYTLGPKAQYTMDNSVPAAWADLNSLQWIPWPHPTERQLSLVSWNYYLLSALC